MRWLRRIILTLVFLGVALGLLLIYIGPTTPQWYEPPDANDADVALLADRVEYRLLEETRKVRPEDEPWTLRIRQEQVNAWLAARLPAWIAHEQGVEWPDELGTPQIRVEDEQLLLAMPLGPPDARRVVVARLDPAVDAQTGLTVKLTGVRLGRLTIPGNPVGSLLSMIGSAAGDRIDRQAMTTIEDLLSGRRGIEPVLDLDDGRRVRITAVACRDDAIDLTSRTIRDVPASSGRQSPVE